MSILRWLGAVILPIPIALVLVEILRYCVMFLGYCEPDSIILSLFQAFAIGFIVAMVPGWLAPSNKKVVTVIITSIYFVAGVCLTICLYSDPRSGTIGQICVLVGMIVGVVAFVNEEQKKEKTQSEPPEEPENINLPEDAKSSIMPHDGFSTPQLAAMVFHLKSSQINQEISSSLTSVLRASKPNDSLTFAAVTWLFLKRLNDDASLLVDDFLHNCILLDPDIKVSLNELDTQCPPEQIGEVVRQFQVVGGIDLLSGAELLAMYWLTARQTADKRDLFDFIDWFVTTPQDTPIRLLFSDFLKLIRSTVENLPTF